jgi:hypothetical protein
MPETFLFRIDGAKENDKFFNALRPSMSYVYAGAEIKIGSLGWSPDFIQISINESKDITLTLIELDATESVARANCRKYLPENSTDIVHTFCEYLERVIRQCRSSAHPHEDKFIKLKTALSKAENINITTAGALRSATDFLENFSLIDQPKRIVQMQSVQNIPRKNTLKEIPDFRGTLRLNAEKAKALGRPVLILDAVIHQQDHSDATFRGWRNRETNKLLKEYSTAYPCLCSFLNQRAFVGTTLDFERLILELVTKWSKASTLQIDQERVRSLINRYFPIAIMIRLSDRMSVVFDTARKFLADELRQEFTSHLA